MPKGKKLTCTLTGTLTYSNTRCKFFLVADRHPYNGPKSEQSDPSVKCCDSLYMYITYDENDDKP